MAVGFSDPSHGLLSVLLLSSELANDYLSRLLHGLRVSPFDIKDEGGRRKDDDDDARLTSKRRAGDADKRAREAAVALRRS